MSLRLSILVNLNFNDLKDLLNCTKIDYQVNDILENAKIFEFKNLQGEELFISIIKKYLNYNEEIDFTDIEVNVLISYLEMALNFAIDEKKILNNI